MTDPAVPRVEDPIGAGINALVAARPSALPHVDNGRWAEVLVGLRSQESVAIARIADEVQSSRLATSSGQALRELAASEFDVIVDPSPSYALGLVTFRRIAGFTGGTIKKGTRFRRAANPTISPPVKDAVYQVLSDTYVPNNSGQFTLYMRAVQPGTAANTVLDDGSTLNPAPTTYSFIDPVFDPTITSNILVAQFSGGSDAPTDDDVRRMARAAAQGRYGPTTRALIAGAFSSGLGVRYALATEDTVNAVTNLIIADSTRSGAATLSSGYWQYAVQQALLDQWCGFGCRVRVLGAVVTYVSVQATITLRDSAYTQNTNDITASVSAALANYFNNRPDFNAYKTSAIRGVIARADRRILTCASVTVTTPSGSSLTDPAAPAPGAYSLAFYQLASNGFAPTYVNPS